MDIFSIVRKKFNTGFILKEMNNTFISLIPKTKNQDEASQFSLISLCNTTYKIIFKLLSSRINLF